MNNPKQFDSESEAVLRQIGGDQLAGSGFENEPSEPEFSEPEAPQNFGGRE